MREDQPVASFTFEGPLTYWRGPAPYYFVRLPEDLAAEVSDVASEVTYGWGMVPVEVDVGGHAWETSLWPKDGGYLLPVRAVVRRSLEVDTGDVVPVRLAVVPRAGRSIDPTTMAPRRRRVSEAPVD